MTVLLCLALRFASTILFLATSAALFTWKYTGKAEVEDRPANVGLVARGHAGGSPGVHAIKAIVHVR